MKVLEPRNMARTDLTEAIEGIDSARFVPSEPRMANVPLTAYARLNDFARISATTAMTMVRLP